MLITESLPASTTLRTIAALVPEAICLLVVIVTAILLAVPLIAHMNLSFGNCAKLGGNSGDIQPAEAPSTTGNPSFPPLPFGAPELSVFHSSYPTPVSRSSEESIVNNDENCSPELLGVGENFVAKSRRPILDESSLVNYNSYRHKLIEETLQKQYGGGYAPGDVILNLIQLNTADSSASVVLSKKYDRDFSDRFKFGEGVVSLCEKSDSGQLDIQFADPLAHFIPRNLRKPSTTDTQTETASVSEISIVQEPSMAPSARPNTPTSCQRIISKRSREANNHSTKSPFVTPIHSRTPLNANSSQTQRTRDFKSPIELSTPGKGEVNLLPNVVLLRDQAPLTEQLYRRNDTRPDVVSKTHVEAEEYLNHIAKNTEQKVQEPRIRSSLKKCRREVDGSKGYSIDNEKLENETHERTGDSAKTRKSVRDDIRRLSTSKPTIWNN